MAVRDFGMSLSTAWLWFLCVLHFFHRLRLLQPAILTPTLSNFVVALTFPALIGAFTPQGAFGWYAAWNVVGFILALLLVPETKALTLEELDAGKSRLSLVEVSCHTNASPCSVLGTVAQARAVSGANVWVAP